MSFIENLPMYHASMVASLKPLDDKAQELAFRLDAHYDAEEKGSHECDCKYCPYGDVSSRDLLSDQELKEIQKTINSTKDAHADQIIAIKRLERYAELVNRPLPKEVLIK